MNESKSYTQYKTWPQKEIINDMSEDFFKELKEEIEVEKGIKIIIEIDKWKETIAMLAKPHYTINQDYFQLLGGNIAYFKKKYEQKIKEYCERYKDSLAYKNYVQACIIEIMGKKAKKEGDK